MQMSNGIIILWASLALVICYGFRLYNILTGPKTLILRGLIRLPFLFVDHIPPRWRDSKLSGEDFNYVVDNNLYWVKTETQLDRYKRHKLEVDAFFVNGYSKDRYERLKDLTLLDIPNTGARPTSHRVLSEKAKRTLLKYGVNINA